MTHQSKESLVLVLAQHILNLFVFVNAVCVGVRLHVEGGGGGARQTHIVLSRFWRYADAVWPPVASSVRGRKIAQAAAKNKTHTVD